MAERQKNKGISGWVDLWRQLDYGPRGALIGLIAASCYFLFPFVLKVLFAILIILVAMLLGGVIGTAVGWIIQSLKKNKKGQMTLDKNF